MATGSKLQIARIEDHRVYVSEGFGLDSVLETLDKAEVGDEVFLDNSDYIAIQTYHRHQVPSKDYKAWDQFRDENGNPLYPQQKILVGPIVSCHGTGCKENGLIQGKIIIVASVMDEQAYPWQADWYRRKVASVHNDNDKDYCRLWYFDNVLHDDKRDSIDELHVTTYLSGLWQALIDLADWVEKDKAPLDSSNYTVNVGSVMLDDSADKRGGIQPVVHLYANESKCAHVKVNEAVSFITKAEVKEGAGKLTSVEWSFENEKDYPHKGEFVLGNDGRSGVAKIEHTFSEAGTYFVVTRVRSQREGNNKDIFTQVRNIDRVRVVVE